MKPARGGSKLAAESPMTRRELLKRGALAGAAGVLAGCDRRAGADAPVVAYCSTDADVARPIFEDFAKATGVRVDAVFDTEATKTTGLVSRLLAEKSRPRADVWWSSEPLGTIALARAGVLAPFTSVHERDFERGWPKGLRGSDGMWYAFARRLRVLAYNTGAVQNADVPKRLAGLVDPRWSNRIGMARPQFGTTRAHVAALHHAHGEGLLREWLSALKNGGVRLYDGNAGVVRGVASGEIWLGLTDSDDAAGALANNWPVRSVPIGGHVLELTHDRAGLGVSHFPEGALQLPGSVAIIKGGPNPSGARRLCDWLLSKDTDDALTRSPFQTWPIRDQRDVQIGEPRRDAMGRPPLPLQDLDLEKVAQHVQPAMALCERVLGA